MFRFRKGGVQYSTAKNAVVVDRAVFHGDVAAALLVYATATNMPFP
jgi:hypothetical protein